MTDGEAGGQLEPMISPELVALACCSRMRRGGIEVTENRRSV